MVRCLPLVSIVAALVSHFVIDVLGDYLLAHDTYDDIGHQSRSVAALVLGVGLIIALAVAVRTAISEARGQEGALLRLLRRATPRRRWRFCVALIVSSMLLVAGMEAGDALAVGRPCDDLTDLLGGSLLLGLAVTTVVAALCSHLTIAALRRFTAFHRAIARLARAFVRIWLSSLARPPRTGRIAHRGLLAVSALVGCSARGRAPPPLPSSVLISL